MRCVRISASDNRMDCRDMLGAPVNPLPPKCTACGFPDLDHIPQPYFLIKSRAASPNELALAENGNFFVRDRIRRVLDLLFPGMCNYFRTCYGGTSQETPWLLAVPNHQLVTAQVKPSIPRCAKCGEPRSAHPGTQWSEWLLPSHPRKDGWTCEIDTDLSKSATWGSCEEGWDQWISRDLFMSVRLLHLLKKIAAKGFSEATCQKSTPANREETAWINEKLQLLETAGVPFHAAGTLSAGDAKWLREYIKTHSGEVHADWDIQAAERRVKDKLPKSYVDFLRAVGPISFENVDGEEGFTASILPPDELRMEDDTEFVEDEESKEVTALTFAETGHGDCFCFDVQKGNKEYAVFLYKHEYGSLEPYAPNFAACIQRFAGPDGSVHR